MKKFLRFLPILVIGITLVACAGKTTVREDYSSAAGNKEATVVPADGVGGVNESGVQESDIGGKYREAFTSEAERNAATDAAIKAGLKRVHFEFDKYTIKESDIEILKSDAQWLKDHPGVNVRIEGHADERGETEYNLALGEKRAMSVKRYLQSLGVSGKRLSIISYGEEDPIDPSHNEEAWAKNRRAEFEKLR